MAALNQAKIINALEKIVSEAHGDFIFSFLLAYGMPKATIKRLQMGDKQRNVAQIAGDVAVAQKIYFHPLQDGEEPQEILESLRALPLIAQHKIRFVMVTDFKTVLAYDGRVDDYTDFDFDDFKTNFEFFLPLTGQYEKAIATAEHPADVKACEKMGKLYDCIRAVNHFESDDLHALNVFLTRLLFCFFAEDTGIFTESNQMTYAVKSNTKEDGSDLTGFFETLFSVLNLPENAPERKGLSATFQKFPYVNGGLFEEQSPIPQFDAKARRLLLDCGYMAWSDISPVIFGSMFQAVMDPDRRRSMGAHYTSEENILKVVRPLFLDALYEEFEQILALGAGKKKVQALKGFQIKLSTLGFLDPACGCGNFLVVCYRELRELELKVLLAIRKDEPPKTQVMDVRLLSKVTINQFYGIELEEFPVEIARVSMWLMEHVTNLKFGEAFGLAFPSIPLQHSAEIVYGNALMAPWEDIVPPEKLHYIFGNPPFVGHQWRNAEQQKDMLHVYRDGGNFGKLDYVCCWYQKAVEYIGNAEIKVAFVSTNSIVQGETVSIMWKPILEKGFEISFAYAPFVWSNDARGKAAVHCVIVGIAQKGCVKVKHIYAHDGVRKVNNINGYLLSAPNVFIQSRGKPLSVGMPVMSKGSQPTDGGNLILSIEERDDLIATFPQTEKWIKRYMSGEDYINNKTRYCLWLKGINPSEFRSISPVVERLSKVAECRKKSPTASVRRDSETPMLFTQIRQPESTFLAVPIVSSSRRKYIPIGYLDPSVVASDQIYIVPNANLYLFGTLISIIHMAWAKSLCGRLKSDYRYSPAVYNNFPWPTPTAQQKKHIESLAEAVLMTREMFPDMTLADMYDPDKMPEPLRKAHTTLDIAVDELYRKKPFSSDEERLQLLFALYEELVSKNPHAGVVNSDEEDESDD